MSTRFVGQRDDDLLVRESGTPVENTSETGTAVYITKASNVVRGFIAIAEGDIDLTTGNTYTIKFQSSATSTGTFADIPGGEFTVSAEGNTGVTFKMVDGQPYVKSVITASGASSSIDGNIYITDKP
jgi:hypothetical protein